MLAFQSDKIIMARTIILDTETGCRYRSIGRYVRGSRFQDIDSGDIKCVTDNLLETGLRDGRYVLEGEFLTDEELAAI